MEMTGITMIKIKLLTDTAKMPELSNANDAGLDLHTEESAFIKPGCRALLKTGLSFSFPVGTVGLIWPRSKLANLWGLDVLGGVIDCDYTGEVMISVINHGHLPIDLRAGDKVAQMIVQEHRTGLRIIQVSELERTDRGNAGINDNELRLK